MPARKDFKPGEFCWIDLSAHDMQAAIAWYSELFGWSHHVMPTPEGAPPYAFFMKGEDAIAGLGQMSEEMKGQGIPPTWNSYISTPDCAATEARVAELGGTVIVPTMEVPGTGKLAFFLDPEGACFAAWQSTSDCGPGLLVDEPGGLCWNELMHRNSEKVMAFYGALNGWEFTDKPEVGHDYKVIQNAGKDAGGMMCMEGAQFGDAPAHWLVYFCVEDCEATDARVAASGGTVIVPSMEIAVGAFSVYQDPQGAGFAVIQPKNPQG